MTNAFQNVQVSIFGSKLLYVFFLCLGLVLSVRKWDFYCEAAIVFARLKGRLTDWQTVSQSSGRQLVSLSGRQEGIARMKNRWKTGRPVQSSWLI